MARATVDADRLLRDLEQIVGSKRVSVKEPDLDTYSRDMWPRLLIGMRATGIPDGPRPHAVVWPANTREVAAVVRLARTLSVPIVPYGGGSGVCGGVVPLRGGITVDVKRMDQVRSVSREDMLCDVEAGINGERFERELSRRGYTFGNFPSSIYCSTVGGWLACRAAGQMSTKYGKVEDRVAGMTVVTGRGDIIETDQLHRASRGPDWNQLIVGSEGTLGVITAARLRVSTAPALRILRGFEFESVDHGVEAIRRVMQRELTPAVVRLYDDIDTLLSAIDLGGEKPAPVRGDPDMFAPAPAPGGGALPTLAASHAASPGQADAAGGERGAADARRSSSFSRAIDLLRKPRGSSAMRRLLRQQAMAVALSRPKLLNSVANTLAERFVRKGCKLIVGVEGPRVRTEVQARLILGELARAGGKDLGEEPGRHWLEHRYHVSYNMSPIFRDGAFVDTMEVATSWDRIMDLYHSVREAISQHALVMAHFSHAYPEGCSIYFTFSAHAEGRGQAEKLYDAIWRDGMAATVRAGGTISHHHGIGLLKAPFMASEHREAMSILNALKKTLDPDDIMNPGKLGIGGGA